MVSLEQGPKLSWTNPAFTFLFGILLDIVVFYNYLNPLKTIVILSECLTCGGFENLHVANSSFGET